MHVGEADRGHKARRLPCVRHLLVELVNLFEREAYKLLDDRIELEPWGFQREREREKKQYEKDSRGGMFFPNERKPHTFSLVDAELHENGTQETQGAPDEKHFGSQVGVALARIDHVGSRVGEGPVEQPVARRGHAQSFGAGLEREDFAGDDPGAGTPAVKKFLAVEVSKGKAP